MNNTRMKTIMVLGARGWRFSAHDKDMRGAIGAKIEEPGLRAEEASNLLEKGERAVICAKGGVVVSPGWFSLIFDAEKDEVLFELLAIPEMEATRRHKGSKGGHILVEVDTQVGWEKIYDKEGKLVLEILGEGARAVIPPSPHRKITGLYYTVIKDTEPVRVKWSYLKERLVEICAKKGYAWGRGGRASRLTQASNPGADGALARIPPTSRALVLNGVKRGGDRNRVRFLIIVGCKTAGLSQEETASILLLFNQNCEEKDDKAKVILQVAQLYKGEGKSEVEDLHNPADILKNPILQADRFGQGMKEGKLYYGVIVANSKGEQLPAVVHAGNFTFGRENLEAQGFRFEEDALLCGDSWKRDGKHSLREYLETPRKPQTTRELLERIISINKRHIFHYQGEGAHIIIAAYALQSYLFTAFPAGARLLILGLENSGKSKQCDLLAAVSCNPINSPDISRAATHRTLEARAGMLIIDNFDKRTDEEKDELVKIYDTSYEDGRPIYKVEEYGGKRRKPKPFRTYCLMVVNGIDSSWIPRSSVSRTIFIIMERNTSASLTPIEKMDREEVASICCEARIWALQNHKVLSKSAAELDLGFKNREEDISRPLLAILRDAGEDYYKKGLEFLSKNFEENHTEDEFSDSSIYLTQLWDFVSKNYNPDKGNVVQVFVADLARSVVAEKGINEFVGDGRKNPFYGKNLLEESKRISPFLQGIPYIRSGKTENRRRYDYNIISLARFMEGRRIDIGELGRGLLQGKLSEPEGK